MSAALSWAMAAVVLAVSVLAACSDSPMEPVPGGKPVSTVVIAPKSGAWAGTLKKGQSIELAAKPLAADGTEVPAVVVTWGTTNEDVVGVSPSGLLVALDEGTAEVTATAGGRTGRMMVVVTVDPAEAPVASVQVSPQALVLEIGQTRQYVVRAFDADGNELSGREATWRTSAPHVASVSATGVVTALSAGYADVFAAVEGVESAVGLTVSTPEEPVTAVIVSPGRTSVFRGLYVALAATAVGPNGGTLPDREITWASENPEIALVGVEGLVLGVAKGTARIRATSGGVSGYAIVEVRELPTGPQVAYRLIGTQSLPVAYVEIGPTQWVDAGGTVRSAFRVVRGGTLRIDNATGTYEQAFVVETRLTNGSANQPAVETVTVRDRGNVAYDLWSGMPILQSTMTAGLVHRAQNAGAGEFVIPQSVLGHTSQNWLWVLE